MEWVTKSPEETIALGERLIKEFPGVNVIGIQGPLGSGKTHLVKGMGLALGLLPEAVKSPTFLTLMSHEGTRPLFHFDFYRHENPEATLLEWWQEHLNHPEALVVVEWPENLPNLPGQNQNGWPSKGSLRLSIEVLDENTRRVHKLSKISMSRQQAEQLFKEFHTPVHVQAHCRQVAQLAKELGGKMKEGGTEVDPELVYLGGLIHDFVRVVDFGELPVDLGTPEDQQFWKALREKYKGQHHADVGADILVERGEPVLAQMVRSHKFSALGTPAGPQTWEEKLIYYADKRVMHDKVVSLEERLEEGWERHFGDAQRSPEEEAARKRVFELEEEILRKCGLKFNSTH